MMQSIKFRFVFLFILLSFSQILAGKTIEELTHELDKELPSKERIDLLLNLSKTIQRNNPKQGYEYAIEAHDIAVKEQDKESEVKSLVQMGAAKMYLGEKAESLGILDEAIEMAESLDYDYLVAESNHIRGLNYYMMGMDEQSLTCYHTALKINQRLGIKNEILRQLNNIALVYRDIKNHDMAISYLKKAIAMAKEVNNQRLLSYSAANIGFVYFDLEEYEKAMPYVDELVNKIGEDDLRDNVAIAIGYNLKSLLENGMKQYDEALKSAAKSLEIARKAKFMDGEIHVMQTISKIRVGQEKYKAAIKIAEQALKMSDETETRRYTEGLLQTLIASTKAIGNNQNALLYQDRLLEFKDSLYSKEKSKLVDQLDIQYITREKEIENQKLRVEQEKDKEIIALQKYITILALFIGVLFIGLSIALFRSLRIKRINNKELEGAIKERTKELEIKNRELIISNQELERFAYVASHDLKEPLRNISSFANLVDRKANVSGNNELKEYAKFIVGGAKQMYGLIDSIMRFSEIKKQMDSDLKEVDFKDVIVKIKNHLSVQLEEKNAAITFKELPVIAGDEDRFFMLFKNLIENGIKYNESENPQISIAYLEKQDSFVFSIKDNGIGIKEEYSKVIFDMFKRLHNRGQYSGSGMGLSICKKIVDLFKGDIWVDSKEGEGSTFYIQIPKVQHKSKKVMGSQQEKAFASA